MKDEIQGMTECVAAKHLHPDGLTARHYRLPRKSTMIEPAPMEEIVPEPPRQKKRKKRRIWRVLQWLIALGMLGVLSVIIAAALIIQHYSALLPSTDQLSNYNPAVVTRLYSSDGKLMAEYAKEKRFFLPLSAIPKNVQQAFISAEDKNFYTHKGVDFMGMLRAMRNNFRNAGTGHLAGGSTITQQVVKNFLLSNEKSYERKIKEAILAYRISNSYSKEKILELYLNEIYLGQSTYGVAAAAVNYFDKSLDQLSTEEAAFLAALPQRPAYYGDVVKNYKAAMERRNYVINRMAEDNYIDGKEAARAVKSQITLRQRNQDEVTHAEFFAEEVRRALKSMYGDNVLYEGGLFVKTTLKPSFQNYTDRALRYALMMYDQRHGFRGPIASLRDEEGNIPQALARIVREKPIPLFDSQTLAMVERVSPRLEIITMEGNRGILSTEGWGSPRLATGDVLLVDAAGGSFKLLQIPQVNGAMVVMDPHTGKVLAMSGGYTYGGSEFNRATQAKRQPGSSFKPFVYLTALENGFSPTSVILDGPISLPQGPGLPMWSPKNYEGDYMGPITFRTALEHSRNAVTVRIASMLGIKRVKRVAKRLNIYDDDIAENYSMVLGAKETTLLRLVNAYSMIANGGRRVSPWFVERIDDRNGATIFRRDTRNCETCTVPEMSSGITVPTDAPTLTDERERVIDPRVAYQITSILQGVVQRGTGTAAKVLNRPVAGKTGTTNDSRDTWFIGYTPDLVVGTFVGYDTPKSLGEKETGGRVAIQGFIKFMQQAANDLPVKEFRAPPGIREIAINKANGQPLYDKQAEGASIIKEAFLTGGPIFKPMNELQEELKENDGKGEPIVEPPETNNGGFDPSADTGNKAFEQPKPGAMAPYQRPVDSQGFDPNAGAGVGTGGLY